MSTLVLAILTTESSYAQEVERSATDIPDTIQFWIAPDSDWRIRTYAVDHDIHVYKVGPRPDGSRLTADQAAEHNAKHYGDITAKAVTLHFTDPGHEDEVRRVLAENGLAGVLEVGRGGVAFYNPDRGEYRTKSTPR